MDDYYTTQYVLGPAFATFGALFILGAIRMTIRRSAMTAYRWRTSEPAQTQQDLKRWHNKEEVGLRNIWPYILMYLVLGIGLLYFAWDLAGDLFFEDIYPDRRIGLLPGTLVGLAIIVWAYLPRKPRRRRD